MSKLFNTKLQTCIGDGDTAQMSADTNKHQPLRLLDSFVVVLRVSQLSKGYASLCLNFSSSPVKIGIYYVQFIFEIIK